jgi:hypothetical protein
MVQLRLGVAIASQIDRINAAKQPVINSAFVIPSSPGIWRVPWEKDATRAQLRNKISTSIAQTIKFHAGTGASHAPQIPHPL